MPENEFVIIKCDGEVLRFHDKTIVVYGDQEEAHDDCSTGERVVPLAELSTILLNEIINQTNKLNKSYEERITHSQSK